MQDRFRFRAWDKEKGAYRNGLPFFDYAAGVVKPDRFILEQCSGLRDKTGKLIYEGDIVEYKISGVPKMTEVVFWSSTFAHYTKGAQLLSTYQKTTVIVGNIHENPELIPRHYLEHFE